MSDKVIDDYKKDKGYCLEDIIKGLNKSLLNLKLPSKMLCSFLNLLSTLEHNLSVGCCEQIQIAALVGGFLISRVVEKK